MVERYDHEESGDSGIQKYPGEFLELELTEHAMSLFDHQAVADRALVVNVESDQNRIVPLDLPGAQQIVVAMVPIAEEIRRKPAAFTDPVPVQEDFFGRDHSSQQKSDIRIHQGIGQAERCPDPKETDFAGHLLLQPVKAGKRSERQGAGILNGLFLSSGRILLQRSASEVDVKEKTRQQHVESERPKKAAEKSGRHIPSLMQHLALARL
jgi:hypothetical protein